MAYTKQQKLTRAMMELCFIATKRSASNKETSTIKRRELMEMILRMCTSWMNQYKGHGKGHKISDNLDEFFRIYISPYYEESTMFTHREEIRNSKHLNKLLYDNTTGLRLLYEILKQNNNLFTIESTFSMIEDIKHPEFEITTD